MDLVQAIVLALIQGITEFLPISSSAHLILPKEILGWPDQGLAFDVAVHVGSLMAVMLYFRKDIVQLFSGWLRSITERQMDQDGRLAWYIIIATFPACFAGLFFGDFIETHMRSMGVIAVTTVMFGILLGYADKKVGSKGLADMTLALALAIGVAQAIALIPGTSRSGITITMALLLGMARQDAAKFSFFLSIPIILISGAYKGLGLISNANVDWFLVAVGVSVSAVSAYLCIHYFLSFINRLSMMPFVIYRILLGAVLVFLMIQ